jgi:curved DNA-binding protein CbpA
VKLHLTDDAPWEVVQAAYKALAFLHHPDRGGSTTRMQQINSALDRIRALKGR